MGFPRPADDNELLSYITYLIGKDNDLQTLLEAHASRHITGGSDPISRASSVSDGLMYPLSGSVKDVFHGDASWSPIKLEAMYGGVTVGEQPAFNFTDGTNVSIVATNDVGNSRVNLAVTGSQTPIVTALLDTNSNTLLGGVAVASAVNYVSVRNATAGTSVRVLAQGSDTDIGLRLDAKGAGLVTVGTAQVVTATSAINTDATARTEVALEGVLVGTRRQINFLTGSNISYIVTDDAGNERVDVEISSTGGSGLDQAEVMIIQSYGGF